MDKIVQVLSELDIGERNLERMKIGKWDVASRLSVQMSDTYAVGSGKDAYARAGPWREKHGCVGYEWLRTAAQSGDTFAMQRLAERLMTRNGVSPSAADAVLWIEKAADHGAISAHSLMGSWILDGRMPGDVASGQKYLTTAAEAGLVSAASELGVRLLSGTGTPADIATGEYWLRVAAESGDRLAMILLGRYLFHGRYLDISVEEGKHWLKLSKAESESDAPNSGEYVYLRALNEESEGLRHLLTNEAARMFLNGHLAAKVVASTNLAYLVRRNEIAAEEYPPLDELLASGLAKKRPFALVNEALRRAAGVQCQSDWMLADAEIAQLPSTSGVLEWWTALLEEGDLEGHLVIAWLVRHGLTSDPDGLTPARRFYFLNDSSWTCPPWLN